MNRCEWCECCPATIEDAGGRWSCTACYTEYGRRSPCDIHNCEGFVPPVRHVGVN